jgi:hypothetical protein
MSKLLILSGLVGLCLTSGDAAAQSLRTFMIEMDRRLDMIDRRLDALEADRAQRVDAKTAQEAERQRAAILELARQCASFSERHDPHNRYNACMVQKARGEQMDAGCMLLELDALSCH